MLANKKILVVGSSGDLGNLLVKSLIERNATVIGVDIGKSSLKSTKNYQHFSLDITNQSQVKTFVEELSVLYSGIVFLASINPKVTGNFNEEGWDIQFDVALTSTYNLLELLRLNRKLEDAASVVFVSSDLGIIGPYQLLYCNCGERSQKNPECGCPLKPASYSTVKAAQLGLVRFLASTFSGNGSRFNAISPSGIEDFLSDDFAVRLAKMSPMGRNIRGSEVCDGIAFLLSDMSTYITGINLVVDGGRSIW